jgi:putative phage-type endonuclease
MNNANILLDDVANNRERFVELRRNYIGASDVPTILGLNNWKTPLDLWMEKTGRKDSIQDNDRLWYGRANEPLVAQLFERRYGVKCQAPNIVYQSKVVPWLTATPDFVYCDADFYSLLECKTPGLHERDKWDESTCPDYVQAQLLTQMFVTGIKQGRAGCIIAGDVEKAFFPSFEFDSNVWKILFEPLERFYECVQKDSPPAVKAGDIDNLNKLFPIKDEEIDLTGLEVARDLSGEYIIAFNDLAQCRREERASVERVDAVKARLRMLMGTHSRARIEDVALEVKTTKRKGFTVEAKEHTNLKIKLPKGMEGSED